MLYLYHYPNHNHSHSFISTCTTFSATTTALLSHFLESIHSTDIDCVMPSCLHKRFPLLARQLGPSRREAWIYVWCSLNINQCHCHPLWHTFLEGSDILQVNTIQTYYSKAAHLYVLVKYWHLDHEKIIYSAILIGQNITLVNHNQPLINTSKLERVHLFPSLASLREKQQFQHRWGVF